MHIRNVLLLLLCSISFGQNVLNNIPVLYYNDRLDELREMLPDLETDHPDHPTVLFIRGVFEQDALTALSLYEQVYTQHPVSEFADDAMFRSGQYYYAAGDYDQARAFFSRFLKQYKDSPLTDRVQYLMCSTIYAQGKVDSAMIFLGAFVRNVKSSPFVDMAIMDLENQELWKDLREAKPKPAKEITRDYKYSIQIGAFSIKNNALRVQEKFGPDHYVEIRVKKVKDRTFYAVWLGRFYDRSDAEKYAQTYLSEYNIDYKIIRR